jgi:hypothetical protein
MPLFSMSCRTSFGPPFAAVRSIVEMYSGWMSWWSAVRISTSPSSVAKRIPSSDFATAFGSADFARFIASATISNAVLARKK